MIHLETQDLLHSILGGRGDGGRQTTADDALFPAIPPESPLLHRNRETSCGNPLLFNSAVFTVRPAVFVQPPQQKRDLGIERCAQRIRAQLLTLQQ